MVQEQKELRSGFTTGACAAAAAKAATLSLLSAKSGVQSSEKILTVVIPFPDGSRVIFKIHDAGYRMHDAAGYASVIKDAGDDPDVTNGAEIVASVRNSRSDRDRSPCGMPSAVCPEVVIKGGKGVGIVTKPGLSIPPGEPAINPVPRKMITDAVREAVFECGFRNADFGRNKPQSNAVSIPHSAFRIPHLEVTISVPQGEELAKRTLNHRLGIIGGISILGTTGIVRPLSDDAWTATIESSLSVAKALGREEIVLSTGRTSERAHQRKYGLPEECYAMMGDYTEFSLRAARERGFHKVHLCAQWAKMIKIAMATPQTHVRHGALGTEEARRFLIGLGIAIPAETTFNTTREMFVYVNSGLPSPAAALSAVCGAARRYCEEVTGGLPVSTHLASYEGVIVAESE